ncbi:VTT domain-containing protein [Kitasatospora sp. NBC_01287]|uniref:DedA family protein n=1 Tax=Kitasatospora sp. NBC_01287 TaxID=2903573 RepID=UPI002251FAF7|nr:VTT domain-containing protein [Kitasatospora sp. NBC_01287]MCX4747578.1 VTT domain-containing protein [Kitasatospora sp. NBC_01287]
MNTTTDLAVNLLDAKSLISSVGTVGLLAIIFAETGLLIGFFLPGDSLLILGGVAASSAAAKAFGPGVQMPIAVLLIGAPICAIAGAQLGHLLGAKVGGRLFDKPESRIFKREYVQKAEEYFQKFGPEKAVVMARFIPIVRTFLNPVAGTLEMPARKFFVWNAIGGVLWTEAMLSIGYFFGDSMAPVIDKYLIPAMALIILLSISPILVEVVRDRKKRKAAGPAYAGGAAAPGEPEADALQSGGRHRRG